MALLAGSHPHTATAITSQDGEALHERSKRGPLARLRIFLHKWCSALFAPHRAAPLWHARALPCDRNGWNALPASPREPAAMSGEILTMAEAAQLLKVAEKTVYSMGAERKSCRASRYGRSGASAGTTSTHRWRAGCWHCEGQPMPHRSDSAPRRTGRVDERSKHLSQVQSYQSCRSRARRTSLSRLASRRRSRMGPLATGGPSDSTAEHHL